MSCGLRFPAIWYSFADTRCIVCVSSCNMTGMHSNARYGPLPMAVVKPCGPPRPDRQFFPAHNLTVPRCALTLVGPPALTAFSVFSRQSLILFWDRVLVHFRLTLSPRSFAYLTASSTIVSMPLIIMTDLMNVIRLIHASALGCFLTQ